MERMFTLIMVLWLAALDVAHAQVSSQVGSAPGQVPSSIPSSVPRSVPKSIPRQVLKSVLRRARLFLLLRSPPAPCKRAPAEQA
jgi:hypothetical protein